MLTERQLLILKAIIDDYVCHAEPVGSRSVSKRDDMNFSPATIRNEMADLEELGFLEKPHSSAGRIPSQKGYRYFVDHMLSPAALSKNEVSDIRLMYEQRFLEFEKIIQQSAKILSSLTSYTSIVLGPEIFESRLHQIQLVPISKDNAVAIIVTDTGHVENQAVSIPEGLDIGEIEKIVNILNERLRGVPLIHLRHKLTTEIRNVLAKYIDHHEQAIELLNSAFKDSHNEKVYYAGKTNILSQPEFNDVNRVRELLNTLEEDALVSRLFRSEEQGVRIRIGEENQFAPFDDCSVITATYSMDGKHLGTVGILGPTRMEYQRVVGLLDFFSKDLTNLLKQRYQKSD
ncbi:heat-inducible transcriptional repressor HrcA [Alteribacter natronophilus]|uniref:heat-inducible transcriptional repressor HrcA n=1 Tax=Alteribacter natronophilus TaxID=2583810 RepID=UPI00110F4391|nr:heat-inducible transcriptional repressor HrcA [Alteribacter natronophilus]TMW73870.1 heat-inducible transcriptional repressor HrcA [Alteribacter natronophilus]